jgi:SAM-dependent methyltransferase
VESRLAKRSVVVGFCVSCGRRSLFSVRGRQPKNRRVNLREGLICFVCRLNNRRRLLYRAIQEWSAARERGEPAVYLAEQHSALQRQLARRFGRLTGSEYVPSAGPPGALTELRGRPVQHQDLRALSFDDESFDLVIHADVLEHVPRHRDALAEIHRVLVPGGETLFTAPFITTRDENLIRATISGDGSVVHHLEPEYHIDPLDPAGVLAFQTFGWELLDELRSAGFAVVQLGFLADPVQVIVSDVVFRAENVGRG